MACDNIARGVCQEQIGHTAVKNHYTRLLRTALLIGLLTSSFLVKVAPVFDRNEHVYSNVTMSVSAPTASAC